jgi:purine catabolism regulator
VSDAVGPGAKVRSRRGAVLALLEVESGAWRAERAEELRREIEHAVGDTVSAGMGGPRPRSAGPYGVAYRAEHALALGRALFGSGRVIRYDELGAYAFILGRPTSELEGFCERVLGPLTDPRHRDLLRTLEEFVRAHGSLNEVARRMYLHRNTVRQRLHRIADLCGADLNDHEDRLLLQLALLGRTALERIGDGGSAHRTDLAEAP